MKSFSYHSFTDTVQSGMNKCSASSEELPLKVNCTGRFTTDVPFTTDNKRGRRDLYLMYVSSGRLDIFNGNGTVSLSAGSTLIIPADTPYKYTYSGGERLCYFWLHFTGSEATRRLDEYSLKALPTVYEAVRENRIEQRFQSIFDSFAKQDEYRDRELSALLDRLLIEIARAVNHASGTQNTLLKSLKYISAHYGEDIRIPFLAAEEHLSVSRYNFLFKARQGLSPTKYILRLRMTSAADLLCSTDLSVKEIGVMCGYRDAHFFSKTFKAYFGVSPETYRKTGEG